MPLGNGGEGVNIGGGASSNWIGVNPVGGTNLSDEGNVISGNGFDGVRTDQANANAIAGNKIGTDVTGTSGMGNR